MHCCKAVAAEQPVDLIWNLIWLAPIRWQ